MLSFALFETWCLYFLGAKLDKAALALRLDTVVRYTFPLIYLSITSSLLVLPFSESGAMGVGSVCILALILVALQIYYTESRSSKSYRKRLIALMRKAHSATPLTPLAPF
jgi:hypothetical protein